MIGKWFLSEPLTNQARALPGSVLEMKVSLKKACVVVYPFYFRVQTQYVGVDVVYKTCLPLFSRFWEEGCRRTLAADGC